MPCVLPVVGLKIMGFVSQAGEDRGRILVLNLAYVAGIIVVFAALAALAIVFNFGWGQQFQYFSVRLAVTLGLFAFALSYFNIWEIPVPGMASGKASQELQSQEGLTGAFQQGRLRHAVGNALQWPDVGRHFWSNDRFAGNSCRVDLFDDGSGNVDALCVDWPPTRLDQVVAKARCMDGDIQAIHGFLFLGGRRILLLPIQ